MKIPPYLQPGDTIGMVCPAGFMLPEKWKACVEYLQSIGFRIKLGRTMNSESVTYFSGTDEERLADLQEMLDDKEVKAILCGRGGYGVGRIIDKVNFKRFAKDPKWIIGFSDITVLLAHINRRLRIATLHAPMAGAFNEGGYTNPYVQSLLKSLYGEKNVYGAGPHRLNKTGKATGELVGGNLALVSHLVGTPSAYKTKGKILFLEDLGELLYNIDRMMFQLKRAGVLEELAGLIIGGFTDNKDTERPFGKNVYDLVYDIVRDYDYPICFGFPVSHELENYALKIGVEYRLSVRNNGVVLEEK